MKWVFLCPYSPEYNSIEFLFNYIKKELKNFDNYNTADAVKLILQECTSELINSFINKAKENWQINED